MYVVCNWLGQCGSTLCTTSKGARFNRSECVRIAQMVEATLEVLQTELPSSEELPVEVVGALETLHE